MVKRYLIFAVFDFVWVLLMLAIFFAKMAHVRPNEDITGAIIVLIIGMILPWGFFGLLGRRPPGWKHEVLTNGKQAPALVLSITDSGISYGRMEFVVSLRLQVQPGDAPPFETILQTTVSRVSVPVRGDMFLVKYDPANRDHILLLNDSDMARGYGTLPEPISFSGTPGEFESAQK